MRSEGIIAAWFASRPPDHPGAVDGVTLDVPLAIGGLLVGIIVGLTGMGGGALMTPMLVFFFGVDPLTAISSDIVVSLFMKPVGAFVHLRHGTVNLPLVGWLCVGSVPLAFIGRVADQRWSRGASRSSPPQARARRRPAARDRRPVRSGPLMQMWRNRLPLGEGAARR